MKVSAIMLGSFYFIVCSTEFVEAGFKFFTICCKLKTTNLKLKKARPSCDKPLRTLT